VAVTSGKRPETSFAILTLDSDGGVKKFDESGYRVSSLVSRKRDGTIGDSMGRITGVAGMVCVTSML
jgi:hypothetical protein